MTTKPTGRDPVRTALIKAGTRLFALRGPASVSVRDIAREAGVNHGLVHRHFDSKDGLLQAILSTLAKDIAEQIGPENPHETLGELVSTTLGATSENEAYWRILAWSLLNKEAPIFQDNFPIVERMLAAADRASPHPLTPQARVTLIVSVGLGMLLFQPYLKASTQQDDATWAATKGELIGRVLQSSPKPKSNKE